MMWLILALIVAFAIAQSLIIERLWRDQRRTRRELEEAYQQVDALAIAVDRQVMTQEQINDRIKPIAAAIRESNQMVVETMDALVNTVQTAKAERRRLSDLIEKATSGRAAVTPTEEQSEQPAQASSPRTPAEPQRDEQATPISWPDTGGRVDITAIARKAGRSRSEVALAQRLGRTVGARKQAAG